MYGIIVYEGLSVLELLENIMGAIISYLCIVQTTRKWLLVTCIFC